MSLSSLARFLLTLHSPHSAVPLPPSRPKSVLLSPRLSSPPQAPPPPPPPFAGVVGPSVAASMDIERLRLRSKFQARQGTFRGAAIFEVASVEQAEQVGRGNASAVLFAPPFAHAVFDYTLIGNVRRTIGSLPLMLKVRAGQFAEAEEIQRFGMVDFLDENEVLGVVDETFIDKSAFSIPFVCGCESLAEGLRRLEEGAQILRMQGKSYRSVQFAETVKVVRSISREISDLAGMNESQVRSHARKIAAPPDLLLETKRLGRLPVLQFAAGGIASTADAALMIRLGCDGVFIIMDAVEHAWQVDHVDQQVSK